MKTAASTRCGPVGAECLLERVPRDDGLGEAPREIVGVAERGRASRRHQQVRPQLSDVEPDRAVEREFAVERLGRRPARVTVAAHHHGAGVQVAVDQRLGVGHEVPLGGADGGDHVRIVGVGGDVGAARRRHRATPPGGVRLAEDEQLRDLAERGVDRLGGEQFELLGIDAERGGSEGDVGDVPPERRRRVGVALAVVERTAPDPVVGQVLDREGIPLRVGVIERWDRGRAQPPVHPQRPRLGVVARRGHRPRGIGSHVRQRLLDHQARGIARRAPCR